MSDLTQRYYSYCLQADFPSALRIIKKSNQLVDKKTKNLHRKVITRFVEQSEKSRIQCDDDFVKSVIQSYRYYYREALLQPKQLKIYENVLNSKLKALAVQIGIKSSTKMSIDSLENLLKAEFKKRGFFAIFGTISPFRSLMVWKKESSKTYEVALPEKKQRVKVIFMNEFIELSWLHFATFGKYYVGGWANKNSLFCVKHAYKVESSSFKVHYLAHEAQHFSDYKSFPKLKQVDLEYRAKLAELSLTKNPRKFVLKLKSEARKHIGVPHSYASYQILKAIEDSISPKKIRAEAIRLLAEHTKSLKMKGSKKVKSIF